MGVQDILIILFCFYAASLQLDFRFCSYFSTCFFHYIIRFPFFVHDSLFLLFPLFSCLCLSLISRPSVPLVLTMSSLLFYFLYHTLFCHHYSASLSLSTPYLTTSFPHASLVFALFCHLSLSSATILSTLPLLMLFTPLPSHLLPSCITCLLSFLPFFSFLHHRTIHPYSPSLALPVHSFTLYLLPLHFSLLYSLFLLYSLALPSLIYIFHSSPGLTSYLLSSPIFYHNSFFLHPYPPPR